MSDKQKKKRDEFEKNKSLIENEFYFFQKENLEYFENIFKNSFDKNKDFRKRFAKEKKDIYNDQIKFLKEKENNYTEYSKNEVICDDDGKSFDWNIKKLEDKKKEDKTFKKRKQENIEYIKCMNIMIQKIENLLNQKNSVKKSNIKDIFR